MAVRQLFRISVLVVMAQLLYSTVTQQCTNGGSEVSILGWMLQHHIYKTMFAELPSACLIACRKDDRCQSFNYVISLTTCEFNDRTKEARPEDFVPNPDRFYFRRDMNRVPIGSIPELPADTCKEITMSEGQSVSRKYWLSTIISGKSVLAHCNMETDDVDECTASSPVCDVNANCTNTRGSYLCTCKAGFSGDGKICKDVDECLASSPVCDVNANCTNTRGSYLCTCKSGFSGEGKSCKDIDECVQGSHDCLPSLASCTNTAGSFNCACNAGYVGDGRTSCEPQECQNYTRLTSVNRKVTYAAGSIRKCDSGIGPGWFRFEGSAGTRMPTSCPPINKCDTSATGWLNGGHPTVADGQVSRTVCFHWRGNCCLWSTSIQVRNCSSFYVYHLSSTPVNGQCDLRYCGTD